MVSGVKSFTGVADNMTRDDLIKLAELPIEEIINHKIQCAGQELVIKDVRAFQHNDFNTALIFETKDRSTVRLESCQETPDVVDVTVLGEDLF